MCKSLMALHVLELLESSLQEIIKRSERIGNFSNLSFQTNFLNEKFTEEDFKELVLKANELGIKIQYSVSPI